VSSIIARRRHPAAGYAAVAGGLVVVGVLYSTLSGGGASAAAPAQASTQVAQGKSLFVQSCSSCHGLDAQGTSQAPSLVGAGAAAVYFQMSTGRMPAKLGGGPPIPSDEEVSTVGANTALGEELFSTNCAQCHGFAGAGGALTYGKNAPSLNASTPTQIYTAMLTGPEAMPVFGDGTITPQEKRDIIAFITDTRNEPNPGGFSLSRTGTVTEGLLIWLGGLGFLVLIAMWLTARRRDRAIDEHGGDHVPGDHATTETAEKAESEHSS
jgi:ubiquinol-cytochrome c reductase cytochrome c subunit